MLSLDVVDTDLFLDMPVSTQNLYFHLSMRADDDGFVSSPKKIMAICNANKNDIDILFAKSFLIPFESWVCVIRHRKVNNYLRGDRYTPTVYQDEYNQLIVDNDKYDRLEATGNQLVYQMDTQVRIGKDSIGKDSIGNNNIEDKKKDKKQTTTNPIEKDNVSKKEYELLWWSDDMVKCFEDFIDYRKTLKKPMTKQAIHLMIKKLQKMANSEIWWRKILEQSILNNRQDVFPLKDTSQKKHTTPEELIQRQRSLTPKYTGNAINRFEQMIIWKQNSEDTGSWTDDF